MIVTQVDSEGWNLKFLPPGGAVIVFTRRWF